MSAGGSRPGAKHRSVGYGAALLFALMVVAFARGLAFADSSSPRLAAYYNRHMAIVDGQTYAWENDNPPRNIGISAVQVGVGGNRYYLLTGDGRLLDLAGDHRPVEQMTGVVKFAAGQSGVLAISADHALWWLAAQTPLFKSGASPPEKIADDVATAAVGDGANYYLTRSGALYVRGKSHRGQYGDGKLTTTEQFVQTASGGLQITAHTGHAILLKKNGDVLGTGGNIYGPVGRHGLGDKAVRWSRIVGNVQAIATGSSHSLAITEDSTLLAWGRGYGAEPRAVMKDVVGVAAGSDWSLALGRDGTLWQWRAGEEKTQVVLP